jgi:hypothetical protein
MTTPTNTASPKQATAANSGRRVLPEGTKLYSNMGHFLPGREMLALQSMGWVKSAKAILALG